MKEYELILELNEKISANKKAKKLVKLGCFEQKDVVDFKVSDYRDLTVEGKLFKGLYRLYEDNEKNLLFAQPEIEADDDGNVHGEASSYDVIFIETMSDEIFNKVACADNKNSGNLIYSILFWFLLVALVLLFILTISNVISNVTTATSFMEGLQNSFLILLFFNLNVGVFAIYTYLVKKNK